jgi:hypothetical protein
MRGPAISAIALLCACKASLTQNQLAGGDDVGDDAAVAGDAPTVDAPLGPFGPPQKVAVAGTGNLAEDDGTLSYSGLEMVFAVVNAGDNNRKDLFYTSRPDLQSAFGTPVKLPFSADGTAEETPRFSADDLTLFFAKTNGANNLDIMRVTRPSAGSTSWSAPQLVQGVNSTGVDKWFMPCTGNRYLMIVGQDIGEGVLGGGPPVISAELSSPQTETGTFLTQDCLTAYFASTRDGTNRIYTSTRTAIGQPWTTPTVVTDFAALGGAQQDPFLSNDGRTFVLVSNVDGNNDVYISTR